eukprot:366458-Chlamydomonas_euryale.AAC.15
MSTCMGRGGPGGYKGAWERIKRACPVAWAPAASAGATGQDRKCVHTSKRHSLAVSSPERGAAGIDATAAPARKIPTQQHAQL